MNMYIQENFLKKLPNPAQKNKSPKQTPKKFWEIPKKNQEKIFESFQKPN